MNPEQHLQIATQRDDGTAVVRASGELDAYTSDQLARAVTTVVASGAKAVELDVAELLFVDSAGLRAILAARDEAVRGGVAFELAGAREQLVRLLELTGLSDLSHDGERR
jgi:anti-sigma B factor antagonist